MNPFKFGTVVDDPYFTDRKREIMEINSFLKSTNHLTIISPRRFGKTSLVKRCIRLSKVKSIYLDMQMVVSTSDMAAQLLKRIYHLSTFEKVKGFIRNFRVIPVLNLNPVTGDIAVSFSPGSDGVAALEDVLNLLDSLGAPNRRLVVIFDEFQEIFRIGDGIDRMLRSVLQGHKNVNYLFLGSAESMIRDIFEKKRSPFYHFASLMTIGLLPKKDFADYLEERFKGMTGNVSLLVSSILHETGAHPYYTQQLAFHVWDRISSDGFSVDVVEKAIDEIVMAHDYDYERLWNTLNRTDMKVLLGLATENSEPLSASFLAVSGITSASTVYSSLKRLTNQGTLIKLSKEYLIDDPFFRRWIIQRRD